MALQHLRSSTANKRPTPAGMSDGQLALNTNNTSPGLFFKDSNGALVKVGPVHVGTTAPNASPAAGGSTGNAIGEQWLDTAGGTYVFKVWDGSAWRSESGTFVDVNGDVMTGALGIIAGSAGSPGLYFSGDTNTGLYSPGADQVAISTGGSGRLFVDASGRVGVGTSTVRANLDLGPTLAAQKLALYADATFRMGLGTQSLEFRQYTHQGASITWGNVSTSDQSTFTEQMRLASNGNLGIGKTVPSERLHIDGNSLIDLSKSHYCYTDNYGIGTPDSNGLQIFYGSSDSLRVGTRNAGTFTERLRIDSSGRVGIGTSAPAEALDVVGKTRVINNTGATNTGDQNVVVVGSTTSGAFSSTYGAGLQFQITNSSGGYSGSRIVSRLNADNNTANLVFQSRNYGFSDAMTLDSSGRLGIGTTSPGCIFHAETTGAEIARLNSTAGIGGYLSVQTSGSYVGYFGAATALAGSGTSSDLAIRAQNNLLFTIGSTERARIDSSGRLLVGTSSSVWDSLVEVARVGGAQFAGIRYGENAFPAEFNFLKSRGASLGTNTIVANGDTIANINFRGADGSSYIPCAQISGTVDGTPGVNDMPGRLVFSTTADGASSPTERARITSDGYVRLSASSPGIQFGGDTAAANALDDYEEGTFTPTIVGTSTAGTGTYTNQIGRYTKIGNRVTFTIYLNWTAHTGTGNIRVSNLPFTSTSATGSFHAASIYADGIPFTGPWLQAYVGVNSTNIGMGQMTAAGVVSGIPMDSAGDITITGHYEV